jgi:hypothetical protein
VGGYQRGPLLLNIATGLILPGSSSGGRHGDPAAQELLATLAGGLQLARRDESAARGRRGAGAGAKGRKSLGRPDGKSTDLFDRIESAYKDRKMIVSLVQQLPESDRKMLPTEIVETTDELYQRALELARTLHDIDSSFGDETPERIKHRLELLTMQPDGPERERQIGILERQYKTASELMDRRARIAARLESSILAMQNMRFDMLRLKSAGVGAVLSDLTQATQQARAISRTSIMPSPRRVKSARRWDDRGER